MWWTPGGKVFPISTREVRSADLMVINQHLRAEGLEEIHKLSGTEPKARTPDAPTPPLPVQVAPKPIPLMHTHAEKPERLVDVLRLRLQAIREKRA